MIILDMILILKLFLKIKELLFQGQVDINN